MSLFDPRVLLAVVIWTALVAFGSYERGVSNESKAAEARELRATTAALEQQAEQHRKAIAQERAINNALRQQFDNYQQEQSRATAQTNRVIADLRANLRRLSIPVRHPACENGTGTDTAIAGGTGKEGRAELTADAAEFLITLAARGDNAIRKHAAVVDLYEKARKACANELEETK